MGGSGGYFSSSSDADELARKVRQAEQSTQDESYVGQVNEYLGSLLSAYNARDHEGTTRVLDEIKREIEADLDTTIRLLFGGSVAKRTYVDGLSDVDMLVCVDKSVSDSLSPSELKNEFAQTLIARFGRDAVEVGDLAVTLNHFGFKIQLLPAFRRGTEFAISSSDGTKWAKIAPQRFAQKLTKMNQQLSSKLVPTIKLAKALLAQLPPQRQLTGYHVEALAINAFRKYEGKLTTKDMLAHFFDRASSLVERPIVDSSGQSVHVDEYMGESGSLERRIAGDTMARFHRRIMNADGARSIEAWHGLFGEG